MRLTVIFGGALWAMLVATVSAEDAHLPLPVVTEVPNGVQRAHIIQDLSNDLRQIGIAQKVESCRFVLDYVQPAAVGKDTSWGAVCSITVGARRQTFVACDDRMVGKFTLSENVSLSREGVSDFIEQNCPPGG